MSTNSTAVTTNTRFGTKNLVLTALLAAIVVLMAFTPLGYLKVGAISVTLLTVPMAVAAIALDPLGSTIVGLTFGITSFVRCFGIDTFGSFVFSLSPVITFIMCVLARTLDGFLVGCVAKAVKPLGIAGYAITGFCAAAFNTILFMSVLIIGFWHNPAFLEKMAEWGKTTENLMSFLVAFVGFNCIFEAITTAVIAFLVGSGLHRAKLA